MIDMIRGNIICVDDKQSQDRQTDEVDVSKVMSSARLTCLTSGLTSECGLAAANLRLSNQSPAGVAGDIHPKASKQIQHPS